MNRFVPGAADNRAGIQGQWAAGTPDSAWRRSMNVVEASGLGKRYGGTWALRECTLEIPAGRVAALDEPVAMLDPVARHDFMATVLTAASADGVSVLLSSHVLTELERVAGYLILLSRGQVRLAGEVDDLLTTHGQASLEELALNYLRENLPEVTR